MILLIDNYDSFTFNLAQAFWAEGAELEVLRNDAEAIDSVLAMQPTAVVLGPGPGRPEGAGMCLDLIRQLPDTVPMLGVCLGHQALIESAGGELEYDPEPTHGRASMVHHDGEGIFRGLPNPFAAGRYHSLRSSPNLPPQYRRSAWTEAGLVMGVRHRNLPRFGVQFHPESILTPLGPKLVANFLGTLQKSATLE